MTIVVFRLEKEISEEDDHGNRKTIKEHNTRDVGKVVGLDCKIIRFDVEDSERNVILPIVDENLLESAMSNQKEAVNALKSPLEP